MWEIQDTLVDKGNQEEIKWHFLESTGLCDAKWLNQNCRGNQDWRLSSQHQFLKMGEGDRHSFFPLNIYYFLSFVFCKMSTSQQPIFTKHITYLLITLWTKHYCYFAEEITRPQRDLFRTIRALEFRHFNLRDFWTNLAPQQMCSLPSQPILFLVSLKEKRKCHIF